MIVVTGGAGFIGSNLVHALNARGRDDIVVVDDLHNAKKHVNLGGARFNDYFDKADFVPNFAKLGKIDAVFHQGACAVTTEQDGRYMMQTNFSYSKDLLHACLQKGTRFIYASSAAVYGKGTRPFIERFEDEKPLNIYGFSKLAFDQHVRSLLPDAGSQITGLRYFNVYGPREHHKEDMSSVILKLYKQHRDTRPLTLFSGSDKFLRDFIHVQDVVKVNLHFFETGHSGIFNCGTGTARSFQDLGTATAAQLRGATIRMEEMPQRLVAQYQKFTCSDNTRLREAGYNQDFVTLEQGVSAYIAALELEHGNVRP